MLTGGIIVEKLQMFCLPYAGGSKSIYFDWIDRYSDIVEVIPIEYSGHGSRFGEELYSNLEDIADDVYKSILNYNPQNYIIYGHSLGSVIALYSCYMLESKYNNSPKAMVIGGMRPPHLKYKDEKIAGLAKDELFAKLYSWGQMDDEIMNEPELLDMLYDIIKADLSIDEEEIAVDDIMLHIPVITMTGLQDEEAPEEETPEEGHEDNR